MKGNSVQSPAEFERSPAGWIFRYNITLVPAVDDIPEQYEYDFVEVADLDRGVLIDAVITARYSYAAQLGKLALGRTSTEWTEYNGFRQSCYTLVDDALARMG